MPKKIEVDLKADSNLANLIEKLRQIYPETAESLKDPMGGNLIMVSGVEVENLGGFDTPLVEGSEIVLVPVTHGG
jgi:molybdopterin converting factor small subunit